MLAPVSDARASLGPGQSGHHGVRFYNDSNGLCRSAADFLGDGLAARQPVVMIATPAHRALILEELRQRGFAVGDLIERSEFAVHDPQTTLASFMTLDEPDAVRFAATMKAIIASVSKRREDCTVRAYGEMVNLLWQDGNSHGAIRLEMLWNKLASDCAFSLLCGYAMGHFYKEAGDLRRVCELHTHHQLPDAAPDSLQ